MKKGIVIFRIFKFQKKLVVFLLAVTLLVVVISGAKFKANVSVMKENLYPDMVVEKTRMKQPLRDKTIYLTFDDGPSENTRNLLDVLKKHDVKATFFVIGREEEEYRDMVREMYDEGHTVAPHTYSHIYHRIYASKRDYLEDFHSIYQYIYDITGEHPSIFRFPGGSMNSVVPTEGIMKEVAQEMTDRGFTYFDWNVVSGDDTSIVYPPEELLKNVNNGIEEKPCAVVLFHDAPLCSTTYQAVDLVIRKFKEEGYKFEKLGKNTQPIQFLRCE